MRIGIFVVIFGSCLLTTLQANEDESERSLNRQGKKVMFPQYSVLQLTMCLVAQVSSLPSHKVAINSGFQINYGLPFRLKDFYSPVFWARSFSNVSSPMVNFIEKLAHSTARDDESEDSAEVEEDENVIETDEASTEETVTTTEEESTTELSRKKRKPKMKRDLNAGQFYSGLRELLSYSGYHDDCLIKSVCELAKHPLIDHDDNVVNEVLHLILTPSIHKSFDPEEELIEKYLYEQAEEVGKSGGDCEAFYGANCKLSPLHRISKFVHPTNEI